MVNILLTGFSPYAGRSVNASWVAASLLQKQVNKPDVMAIEIPVVWGEPQRVMSETLRGYNPEIIIAMGEGKPGCIQLETLALNQRAHKRDNTDSFPIKENSCPDGPEVVKSSAPLVEIRNRLIGKGVPVLLSLDPGGFLCEEILYILETTCIHHPSVNLAMFVHLPPYGTPLRFRNRERVCEDELLLEFTTDLIEAVTLNQSFSNC